MRTCARLLAATFLSIAVSGCPTFRVSDIAPGVTLPYSQKGFRVHVLTRKEFEVPKPEWDMVKARSIILTSEDWKVLRRDIQANCQMAECIQITGAIDSLFIAVDQALQKIPGN